MRSKLLAGSVFSTVTMALLGGVAAHAQTAPPVPEADEKNQVTVTATRQERRVDEVPGTVSVIDDKKIENEIATDIKDLIRFEPGVSVRSQPSRFGAALGTTGRDGNSSFNIRGLDGNRVLIQTDGVRVPDGYTFGAQAQGRGDFVDLDLLKSVEILRGPASALYGSDGVAGVVSFATRDPADLLQDGRNFAVRARSAYSSADISWANSLMGATQYGDWSALLAYTHRDAKATQTFGDIKTTNSTRTAPNPTDISADSILGKIVWAPLEDQRFRFTFDRSDRDVTTEVLTGRAVPLPVPPNAAPYAATGVIDLDGTDNNWRERFTFDHEADLGEGFLQSAKWSVYLQQAKTRQYTFEDRYTAADRVRDTTFDNKIAGASGQLDGAFETGPASHSWLLGADYSKTRQTSIRNGTVPPAGESFPSRPFPNTDYTLAGVFVQDEISFLNGSLKIYPALRYDSYELSPERDALYPANQPATASSDDHVSPKLGVVVWPSDFVGGFVNYAAGYKAPAPSQVNSSFSNPTQFYSSIANPDLRPESSDSIEAGVRVRNINLLGGELSGNFTVFNAEFEDFIEQLLVSGGLTVTNPGVFQYVNLSGAEIHGWESRLDLNWDNGLTLTMAGSKSEGKAITPGTAVASPLQSTDPFKFVAGLTYADPAGVWGGSATATYSDSKAVRDVSTTNTTTLFLPEDFTVIDITAYYNITEWASLRAGVFNLFDQKYWWWSDVRGLGAASTVKDSFTQPGVNYSASLTFKY